jgi:hypothetical protein
MAQGDAFSSIEAPRPLPAPQMVQVGTFGDISNAKRVASRLSGFGEAVIDEDTRNGQAVHVVRVRIVDAAGPQAVIDAAGQLGLPGAFVVQTAH